MKATDNGLRFGFVTVIAHWVGAVLLLSFSAGALISSLADHPGIGAFTLWIGVLTSMVHAFRLYWRVSSYYPAPLGGANPAQVLVGRGVGLGMLLAGVVLPLMFCVKDGGIAEGFMASQGWWFVPLFWLGYVMWALGFLLHLYGAYTHVRVLKDDSLKRITGRWVEM